MQNANLWYEANLLSLKLPPAIQEPPRVSILF
jgi:hypothetical protein